VPVTYRKRGDLRVVLSNPRAKAKGGASPQAPASSSEEAPSTRGSPAKIPSTSDIILQRFLSNCPLKLKYWRKEVPLHSGEEPFSTIRVDFVGFGEDETVYVGEVKPYLNRAVIGEAICGKVLWELSRPEDKGKVKAICIVGKDKPILREVAKKLGIKVFVVS